MKINELKENAQDRLNEFIESFDDFEFNSDGIDKGNFSDLDSFIEFIFEGDNFLDFSDLKKMIKKNLYAKDDDVKVSDLDWDYIESVYDQLINECQSYRLVYEQLEGFIDIDSGIQVGSIEIHTDDEILTELLKRSLTEKTILPVDVDGCTHYIFNPDL